MENGYTHNIHSMIPAGTGQRWNLVKNRLKRRQRDINVILTLFYERWFNISNQTSIHCPSIRLKTLTLFQRRFNVELWLMRFTTKYRRCFNVGKVTFIQYAFSIFSMSIKMISNVGSTFNQRNLARCDIACFTVFEINIILIQALWADVGCFRIQHVCFLFILIIAPLDIDCLC